MPASCPAPTHALASLAVLIAATVLAGCASTNTADAASATTQVAASAENTVVCGREEGTGSRIQVTRCRKVAEVEARRNRDREMADKIPTVVPDVR